MHISCVRGISFHMQVLSHCPAKPTAGLEPAVLSLQGTRLCHFGHVGRLIFNCLSWQIRKIVFWMGLGGRGELRICYHGLDVKCRRIKHLTSVFILYLLFYFNSLYLESYPHLRHINDPSFLKYICPELHFGHFGKFTIITHTHTNYLRLSF